ncbi:MAG TPA: O-antigen ligase family protein [Thermoleophilaceae bacterium]
MTQRTAGQGDYTVKASASTVLPVAVAPRRGAPEPRFDVRHPGLVVLIALVFGSLVVGVAASRGIVPGVVGVLAIAVTLWAVRNPATGAIALVAIVPACSGMRRGLPVPGLRLGELLTVGFAVMLLTTAGRSQWRSWRAFDWLALGYVVATFSLGLLDTLLRGDSLSGDDLGKLLAPLQFFLLYRAVLVALPQREQRVRALDWLLIGSLVVSAAAMLQALQVPAIDSFLVTFTGEDWSGRLTWALPRVNGLFPHWTMLAGYLFSIIVVCAALLLGGVGGRRRRLVLFTVTAAAVALVLTVTMAPMLGALAGTLLLAWWYGRAGRVLVYAAVACAVLLIAFQPLLSQRADEQFETQATSSSEHVLVPHTVTNRIGFWTDQYLPALAGRWLTGYGPQVPPEVTWKFTESAYIALLLRGGLPLLALYVGMTLALALVALDVARRRARDPRAPARAGPEADEFDRVECALARSLFVLIVVLAVIQITAPYFTTTGLPHVWWILAAFVAGAASQDRRQLVHERTTVRQASRRSVLATAAPNAAASPPAA